MKRASDVAAETRRPVRMSDIAKLAGVSASTVSRALTGHPTIPEATQDTIREIAARLGYVVNQSARSLRRSETQTVAIAVPLGHESEQLISDPFFLRLFGHLADEISSRRYDVLLVREPEPDAGWLNRLVGSQRADGLIVVGQSTQHEALNRAAKHYRPMVVHGARLRGQRYCSVGSDNFEGGRLATKHLLDSGRKRLVFVGPGDLPQIDMRLEGFREALRARKIEVDDSDVLPAHFIGPSAYEAVQQVLKRRRRPDGIFAASDGIALAAIRAIEDAGLRCPEDVAVVGFDDTDVASHSNPTLTTVRQDIGGIATALVDLLFRRLSGEETPSVTLPVQLVVRESAPAR